jgi:hypothetical protein
MDQEDWPRPESAERSRRGEDDPNALLTREQLRERLPEREVGRDAVRGRDDSFPEQAEVEYEGSVIRIPFYLKGKARREGRRIDVMVFDAYMRLIRLAPVRNAIGLRQFEFYIDAWELTNTYSKGLDADVTFTLSDTTQPKSLCIARQRESDYPAVIVYNAIYDVYLGSERIREKQPGTAVATPVWEIPPRNVTVAFEKPFESELFSFRAGCCEGMHPIPRPRFEEGVALAQSIRGHA